MTAAAAPIENSPDTEADLSRLRNLIPLRRLSDSEFDAVVASTSLESAAAGRTLFRAGVDDRWMYYLLDGSVEIHDDKGDSFSLTGGSIETAHPLCAHAQARQLALAKTDISFVRMPRELLRMETQKSNETGFEVEELGESIEATDKRIMFDVYHALMDNSFVLPTLPDIAVKLRQTAHRDDVDAEDIVRIVQGDPAVAAYCIRMANNAAYATRQPVVELREAIVRMGISAASDLIIAYTLKGLYRAPDKASKRLMHAAWQHSARIAALTYVISKHVERLNPEQAFLSGLLHDIGMLVVIREWHHQSSTPLPPHSLRSLARELGGSLGAMVMRNWHMPDSIVSGALEPEHWSRAGTGAFDLCDCITLAHLHDESSPPWSLEVVPVERSHAFQKLPGVTLGTDGRFDFSAELREDFENVLAGLNH